MTKLEDAAVVDFETDPIRDRPAYPPAPVGVAIKLGAAPATYHSWGHPSGNSCTRDQGVRALRQVWTSQRPLLFHNAKFDVAVAVEKLGLPMPAWDRIHDTLPMLFLLDPRASTYSLKPSAEQLLKWAPEERDAVTDWLVEHQPVAGAKLSRAPKSPNYAGAYIGLAPPALVGPYAVGDVDRTRALALYAVERLMRGDMVDAYDRERRLLPVIMTMEQAGVRVDVERLAADLAAAETTQLELDSWLWVRLGRPEVNLDSGAELAAALVACGAATRESLGQTATGKLATNKDALASGVLDKQLLAVLRYRAQLKTSTSTFMAPWLATASQSGGLIYTAWHSTRTSHHEGSVGARTGRLTSTPNFQNIPKAAAPLWAHEQEGLPEAPLPLPPLPRVRGYVVPNGADDVLCGRDFASQELRVLAHYEDDALLRAYNDDPELDLHQHVADMINAQGYEVTRRHAKTLNFATIYGVGLGHLAELLACSVDEAKRVRDAYFRAFPSIRALMAETSRRWKMGGIIRTLGGRVYQCEDPKFVDGRMRQFEYRALNVIVQGSSADLTKDAMIAFAADAGDARLLLTVHDELVISAPRATWPAAMTRLQRAMDAPRLDVPMRSSGYTGPNWADLQKLEN